MEILGYFGAVLMGLSLGLIGGGGSILTVPILVYLFHIDVVMATAYSLFIVGLTSLIGSGSHMRQGNIHWRTAIVFGIPSIVGVYAARALIVPALPDPLFQIGEIPIGRSLGILILFAALMVIAAYSMIRKQKIPKGPDLPAVEALRFNYALIMGEGAVVGAITGLVGAGGGFLIIPALVFLAKLPMKIAVGTSLIIIAAKSLIGFLGDLNASGSMDWNFLLIFSSIAIAGILLGSFLSKRIANERLKPAFGWFVLAMGIYIITREIAAIS
ncbi:MAG: sulfite exporter TauE/SafE family protein [Bacteroidota bacterium]|nr:sulfite exporter TauE/SafE family protein [Bacteroidota bacterium]